MPQHHFSLIRREAFFMNEVWETMLKIHASVINLGRSLQARERARLTKLEVRVKAIENTVSHLEKPNVQATPA